MIRLLLASGAALFALLSVSCCCTSESRAPRLRSLPRFQELPPAVAPVEVVPAK